MDSSPSVPQRALGATEMVRLGPAAVTQPPTPPPAASDAREAGEAALPEGSMSPLAGVKAETDLPRAYLSYLDALQSAWPDLPELVITYDKLAYEVSVPAAQSAAIPNLLSATVNAAIALNPLSSINETALFHPLHKCSGVVRPGQLTLLLAPPGHGKSVLLKSLAGRMIRDGPAAQGEIRWNGFNAAEAKEHGLQVAKLCAFVEQGDVHFPMLTVRETFQFALDNSNADSSLLQSPEFAAQQANKVELMLELLGLKECADTVVGDTFLRGVSGGQKKRVTLGEMMIGQARALFLDEISTGLDAAATFDIASALKKWTRVMGGSAMVALLQPAPDVFEMFDNVILMRHGHVVFNGTQPQLRQHLADCNIVPNPDVDFADWIVAFLTDPPAVWKRDLLLKGKVGSSVAPSFNMGHDMAAHDAAIAAQPLSHYNYSHPDLPELEEPQEVIIHLGDDDGYEYEERILVPSGRPVMSVDSLAPMVAKSSTGPLASPTGTAGAEPRRKGLGKIITSQGVPLSTAALRKRFEESQVCRDLHAEISTRNHALKTRHDAEDKAAPIHPFTHAQFFRAQSRHVFHHTMACLHRQKLFMLRSPTFVLPRLFQALFMGMVAGSLFYKIGTGPTDYTPRLGLILFSMVFISLINMAEIPLASQFKLVVYKQVDAGFYSPVSYVFSVVIMHLPLAFSEVFIYTTCIYYLSDFAHDASRWWFLVLVFQSVNLCVSVTFRSVAYAMRNADVATNIAGPITSITLLFGGFLITQYKVADWLVWVYWLSPYSWGLRSGALNEFHSGRYPDPSNPENTNGLGDQYLNVWQISTDDDYKWAGIAYLLGSFVLFIFINAYLLSTRRSWLTVGTRRSHDESEEAHHSLGNSVTVAAHGHVEVRLGVKTSSMMAMAGSSETAVAEAEGQLAFTRMDLSFSDLRYVVTVVEQDGKGGKRTRERALLQGVNGYARAGELTALMGSSGAGKTTLMDVIAGRKTSGTITGKILINGHPQKFPDFSRLMGYCEQADIHVSMCTVREALEFSARMRLPSSVSEKAREDFVTQILHDLELTPIAGRIIGDENIQGLSPGELKRVTIGVELAANPTFLFLDEPTSGLDSRAALIVMRVIHKIARRGRSVICTIHQPSAELFSHFDRLLLLKSGGREVYCGPVGQGGMDVARYFLEAPLDAKFYKPSLPAGANVASWMLDVIGAGTSAKGLIAAYDEVYKASPLREQNLQVVKQLAEPRQAPATFPTLYAADNLSQFKHVLHRLFTIYWRDTNYNFAKFRILIFMSFVFGLVYLQIDDSDEAGMTSKIGSVYASVGFVCTMHVSYSMPFVLRMRAVFYRERAANTYAPWIYSTALGLVELPYLFACTLMFVFPMYWMLGFAATGAQFFHFVLVMFLLSIYFSFLGQLFSSLSPNMQVSDIFASMCLDLVHLFGGVLIQKSAMPIGWQWMYHINAMPKAIMSICVNQFYCDPEDASCPKMFSVQQGNVEVTQWQWVATYFSTGKGWEHYYLGWMVLMIVIVRVLVTIVIEKVSHVRR